MVAAVFLAVPVLLLMMGVRILLARLMLRRPWIGCYLGAVSIGGLELFTSMGIVVTMLESGFNQGDRGPALPSHTTDVWGWVVQVAWYVGLPVLFSLGAGAAFVAFARVTGGRAVAFVLLSGFISSLLFLAIWSIFACQLVRC